MYYYIHKLSHLSKNRLLQAIFIDIFLGNDQIHVQIMLASGCLP